MRLASEDTPGPGDPRVDMGQLQALLADVFAAAGLDGVDAVTVAGHLVLAEARGVASHGVSRTGVYVGRLGRGLVRPRPRITEVTSTPVSTVLDGDNGPGIVVADRAMRAAIDKANTCGVGTVAVRNSNHCGMLAAYTAAAAANGLIGVAMTAAPPTMAPWGGAAPMLGTNPLSYAVPTPPGNSDIVFDMATSHVARGKVILADKVGASIPLGWALDTAGEPTQDTAAALAGTMLPVGGAKGSGLALLVDVLSGVLPGANHGPHIPQLYDNPDEPQNLGHFFLALRPEVFAPQRDFAAAVASMAEELAASPPARGHERVLLPGEPEARREAEHRAHGIALAGEVRAELAALATDLGVAAGRVAFLAAGAHDPGVERQVRR